MLTQPRGNPKQIKCLVFFLHSWFVPPPSKRKGSRPTYIWTLIYFVSPVIYRSIDLTLLKFHFAWKRKFFILKNFLLVFSQASCTSDPKHFLREKVLLWCLSVFIDLIGILHVQSLHYCTHLLDNNLALAQHLTKCHLDQGKSPITQSPYIIKSKCIKLQGLTEWCKWPKPPWLITF